MIRLTRCIFPSKTRSLNGVFSKSTVIDVRFVSSRSKIPRKRRPSRSLEVSKNKSNEEKVFAFGKFSGLSDPKRNSSDSVQKSIKAIDSFESLRVFPTVREAMKGEIKQKYNLKSTYIKSKDELELHPSPIQIAALRKINQPRSKNSKLSFDQTSTGIVEELVRGNEEKKLKVFTIAAETGSGKTWAYLGAIMSKLKEQDFEAFSASREMYKEARGLPGVRCVILLPTHELVNQVYETINSASQVNYDSDSIIDKFAKKDKVFQDFLEHPDNMSKLGFKVSKWGAGDPASKFFQAAQGGLDILVSTPSKIMGLAKLNNYNRPFRFFNLTEFCVVDEADTLLDESWIADTTASISKFPRCKDLVFCSATMPREFNKTITRLYPDERSIINIVTPQLHKIPKEIAIKVIDANLAPYNGSKSRCLAQALYAIHKDGTEPGLVKRIVIFVNEKKDVQPLVDTLVNKYGHNDEDIVGITGFDSAENRTFKLEPFLKPADLIESDPDQSQIKVLVTTDLLARGINFVGIKNVILMDMPNSSVDLVHRVGRTGRMKQSGRVFIIIDKKSKKHWIKGLSTAVRRGVRIG